MTFDETTVLLGFINGVDKRVVLDERTISAWANVLPGDITLERAIKFVREHYQETDKTVLPAHIVGRNRMSLPTVKPPAPPSDHECMSGYILIDEERNGQIISAVQRCPQC